LKKFPNVRVVQLFAKMTPRVIEDALKAGVSGYLFSHTQDELVEAIRTVMKGRNYSSPEITSWMAKSYRELIGTKETEEKGKPWRRPKTGKHRINSRLS
jgi:DNA-binding NarL/FixJ family response regulator